MTDQTQPPPPDHTDPTDPIRPTDPVVVDPIELDPAERRAHRSTARWAADRFVTVLRRITPAVVFDRWGQPMGIPDYGCPAFALLPPEDPRREAALITAAEAWRQSAEDAPARIHATVHTEPALGQRARDTWELQRDDAERADWQRLVRDVRSWANHPTAVQRDALRARRERAAARTPAASPTWPPVAVPGRPGYHRHLTGDGHQVDRPDTDTGTDLAESA
ncbi:hypothetical protein AB0K43_20105 [Kitasatospora sp. NPDC049258]|uniref:hypothetical protein n=1 Tax=Kitasatospora sp. NPDC049258 TaxID=3155394 RepID=UPI003418D1B6